MVISYLDPATVSHTHQLKLKMKLAQSVSQIQNIFPLAKIIIGGDFNAPGINWSNKSLSVSYVSKHFWESLVAFTNVFMLEQIVSQLTRSPNILDHYQNLPSIYGQLTVLLE